MTTKKKLGPVKRNELPAKNLAMTEYLDKAAAMLKKAGYTSIYIAAIARVDEDRAVFSAKGFQCGSSIKNKIISTLLAPELHPD